MNAKLHTPDDTEKSIKNPFYFGTYKSAYYRKLQISVQNGIPIEQPFDALMNIRVKITLPTVEAKRGFLIKWKTDLVSEFLTWAKLSKGNHEIQTISGNFIKFHRGLLCSSEDLNRYNEQESTNQNWSEKLESKELSIELPFTFTRDSGYSLFGFNHQDKFRIDIQTIRDIEYLLDVVEVKYNVNKEIKRQTLITENIIDVLGIYDFDLIPEPEIIIDTVDKFNELDKTALLMDRKFQILDSFKFLETSEPDGILWVNSDCHTIVIHTEDEIENMEIHDGAGILQILDGNDLKCYHPLKSFKRKPNKNYYGWSNALNYREILSIKPNISVNFIKITTKHKKPIKVLILTSTI